MCGGEDTGLQAWIVKRGEQGDRTCFKCMECQPRLFVFYDWHRRFDGKKKLKRRSCSAALILVHSCESAQMTTISVVVCVPISLTHSTCVHIYQFVCIGWLTGAV